MLLLDPKTRVQLRKDAHHLHPLVLVGEAGLTPAVLAEVGRHLDAHGLIKIRANTTERVQRQEWWDQICTRLHAAPIAAVGKLLIVFRPKLEPLPDGPPSRQKTRRRSAKRRVNPGLKTVTVVKPSGNPQRPSQRVEVVLKGNERITMGGIVKPRYVRQKSLKKLALKVD